VSWLTARSEGFIDRQIHRSGYRITGDDHRRNDLNFKEPRLSANFELVEKLTALAKKRNATGADAIAWVLRRPE